MNKIQYNSFLNNETHCAVVIDRKVIRKILGLIHPINKELRHLREK
jgi:hypothetical protein